MKREQLGVGRSATVRRSGVEGELGRSPDATPAFLPPMKCKPVEQLPVGEDWLYELKLDGYRALAIKVGEKVQLISRNQKDPTKAYPEVADAIAALALGSGVLDGEIVALDASGKPSFQALQHAPSPLRGPRPIYYYAFDVLNLEGKSTLRLPLVERKLLLAEVLTGAKGHCRFLPALEGERDAVIAAIRELHLEGVVAKLAHSLYEPDRRSGAWVKFKLGHEQEFVIGGYTRGQGGRSEFGALIVGYYEDGKLRYGSKVGTGFSNAVIRQILAKAESLKQPESPFDEIPESGRSRWGYGLTAAERKTAVWLEPILVCQIRFTEWTDDGHLRHPAFQASGTINPQGTSCGKWLVLERRHGRFL